MTADREVGGGGGGQDAVSLVEFMYVVSSHARWSYCRRFGSLSLCDVKIVQAQLLPIVC